MLTLLSTFFAWALSNKLIAGGITLFGSKILFFFEEWFKRKYFPEKQEVIIREAEPERVRKVKVVSKRKQDYVALLLFVMVASVGFYLFLTFYSFNFMKNDTLKLEAMQEMKLIVLLSFSVIIAKLLSFGATLENFVKALPLIKNFIKK